VQGLVYNGAKQVAVEQVPDAKVREANDAVIRLTTSNICGSDLHMYEGRTAVEQCEVLGHENMGVVEEVGPDVRFVQVGDRVSVPFNIACGTCRNCATGWTSFCTRMNPTEGMDGAAYGYANMGPYDGGQAELLRVPFADFNPPGGRLHQGAAQATGLGRPLESALACRVRKAASTTIAAASRTRDSLMASR